jgi:hypothetical protein
VLVKAIYICLGLVTEFWHSISQETEEMKNSKEGGSKQKGEGRLRVGVGP